jgi:hypothetical protein
VTNHRDGGIADVYDRHRYQEENKKIMETVARHIVTIAEQGRAHQHHRAGSDALIGCSVLTLSKNNLSGQTK